MWLIDPVLNPLMRRLVPTPAGRLVPGFAVLRFTGRRTGREFVAPTGIYDYDGAEVVFSDSAWIANFRSGHPVTVSRRGRTRSTPGTLVTDPTYIGPALREVMFAGASQLMLGIKVDRGHTPTDAELAAVRSAVVLSPTPAR